MTPRVRSAQQLLIASLLIAGVAGVFGGASPAIATAPSTRVASPTGTGDTCTTSDPCGVETAINGSAAGDHVVVEAGMYGSSAEPLTDGLGDSGHSISITGAGASHTSIFEDPASGAAMELDGSHSTLSGLTISSTTAPASALVVRGSSAVVSDVAAYSTKSAATCTILAGSLLNSLCVASNDSGDAISTDSGSKVVPTITISGVTAIATGADAVGLYVEASGSGGNAAVDLTNSIVQGGNYDIEVTAVTGASATVTPSHSNYETHLIGDSGGPATLAEGSGNITTKPAKFLDAGSGNYAEFPTSPTANHGAPVASGQLDLAGNPRTIGAAPDIGAYELLQTPDLRKVSVTSTTSHSAHLSVRLNTEGLKSSVKVFVHHKTVTKSAGSVDGWASIHVTIKGLSAHTTYHYEVRVTNAAGYGQTPTETFRTKK
jgi:hypothetical protein